MNKLLFVSISALLISFNCSSQSVDMPTVSSSGEHFTTSNAQLTFTIGEIFISNHTASVKVSEGFNQGALELVTGLSLTPENSKIKVYPNPAQNSVLISAPGEEVGEILIYDLSGKVALNKENPSFNQSLEIDLNEVKAGYYIIKVIDKSKKLIASQNFIKL